MRQAGVGDGERDAIIPLTRHFDVVAGKAPKDIASHRSRELAQLALGLIQVGGVTDLHRHRALGEVLGKIGIADAGAPQRLAHVSANIAEPILNHLLLVELVEEMGAALQVETEIDLFVRQPGGNPRHRRTRKQVGKRVEEPGDDDHSDQDQLPSLEMQHCRARALDRSSG